MIGRSEQTISNSFNCFFDVYFLQNSNSQEPKMSKVGEVQFLKAVKMQKISSFFSPSRVSFIWSLPVSK